MTFLDRSGHISISWSKDDDDIILPMIQEKIDQGCRFFITKGITRRKKQIIHVNELNGRRNVILSDENLNNLLSQATTIRVDHVEHDRDIETIRVARTATEVVNNDTVVTRQMYGG